MVFVLMLLALILFVLSALGTRSERVNLTAAGLALLTAALMAGAPRPF